MCEHWPSFISVPLLTITFVVILASPLAAQTQPASAAQKSPASPQDQTTQIDQLLKECGESQTNERFAELAQKAKEALALSQKLGDKSRIARSLTFLGSAAYYRGQLKEALELHKQAAALALEAGNKRYYGTALQNAGATLSAMGQYEEALYYLTKTVALGKELHERLGVWWPLRNIGYLYLELGDYEKAEPKLQEALAIAREFKNKLFEEASLISLIELRMRMVQFQLAREYSDQASLVDSEVKNPGLHYELLGDRAEIYAALGSHQSALESFRQALELARSMGTQPDEAQILSSMGVTQQALGQSAEALETQLHALAVLRKTGAYPDVEAYIDARIAAVFESQGRNQDALAAYRDALRAVEQIRSRAVPTESSIASISASRRDLFVAAVDLLCRLGKPGEALDVAEGYRARAFVDLLASSRIDLSEELRPEQRQREQAIFDHISAIQKELFKEGTPPERQQQLKMELTSTENELEDWRLALRRENPRYANLQHPKPVNVDRIQREILDPDTVLVEYLLGDKRSFAWVVSKKSLSVATLPPRKEIEEQVNVYRQTLTKKVSALTAQRDLAEYQSRSEKLYTTLIGPIASSISSSQKLLIVPDGVLAYLPFETLVTNRAVQGARTGSRPKALLERFAITYVPSASALAAIKSRPRETTAQPKSLLAFGDPVYDRDSRNKSQAVAAVSGKPAEPGTASFVVTSYGERGFDFTQLPNTRDEVLAIASLYPPDQSSIHLGAEAREETLKAAKLDQYRYIHFAAHALIDDRVPARSGIVLSLAEDSKEDGVLQMSEIMRLKLNASLVTLSACSTGLGKLYDGEGIVGLTRAFFYAGADSVVVSLWNVNDFATGEFMKTFYRNLSRGIAKDAALRQAKLAMLKSRGEWRHPYFWAPFVLVGER